MNTSKLWSLNWKDVIHGLITAIIGSALAVVMNDINSGNFNISGTALWHGALLGGIPYLLKIFGTPADTTKEITKTNDGTVTKTVVNTDSVKVDVKQ